MLQDVVALAGEAKSSLKVCDGSVLQVMLSLTREKHERNALAAYCSSQFRTAFLSVGVRDW